MCVRRNVVVEMPKRVSISMEGQQGEEEKDEKEIHETTMHRRQEAGKIAGGLADAGDVLIPILERTLASPSDSPYPGR